MKDFNVIVFVAGMMRSGSTFTFNVVRELLTARGIVHAEADNDVAAVAGRCGEADHVIVKAHNATAVTLEMVQRGLLPTICTWRKPVDAIASWIDTFGFSYKEASHAYREWLGMFSLIKDHALLLHYDDIENQRTACVRRIADHLLGGVSEEETQLVSDKCSKANAKAVADKVDTGDTKIVDIGFSRYDPVTFLHRRHVSSMEVRPAEGRIANEMIAMIKQDFSEYLDELGNLRFDLRSSA